jgi:hypothetical protein
MSERLEIENFGPIKKMSFEFKKINILIGEQSTGKSMVAKLVAAINKMATGETLAAGSSGMMRKDEYGKSEHFKRHLKVYEIESYLKESTKIIYQHNLFDFEFISGYCSINKKLIKNIDIFSLDYWSITFIPAERVAINLTNKIIYWLNEAKQDLPSYFNRFAHLFNKARERQKNFDFSDTLTVVYKYEDGNEEIEMTEGQQIKMQAASSAIQANIPLLVILRSQSQTNKPPDFYSFNINIPFSDVNVTIIEEPELNCFPSLQKSILEYIVRCIRPSQDEYIRRTMITTHSPYILTSVNNLMYAYHVGQNHKEEANKIIEEMYWVNPEDVSAYQLLSNGTCDNILDKDEGLIEADKIDEVSKIINRQFDNLMNIEFEKA